MNRKQSRSKRHCSTCKHAEKDSTEEPCYACTSSIQSSLFPYWEATPKPKKILEASQK